MSEQDKQQNETENTNVSGNEQAGTDRPGTLGETVNTQQNDTGSDVKQTDKENEVSSESERQRQRMANAGVSLSEDAKADVKREQETRTGVGTHEQPETVETVNVETSADVEVNELPDMMPQRPAVFMPESFEAYRPSFRVQIIIPLVTDTAEKTIEVDGENFNFRNTLAREGKGPRGLLFDAVTEVMEAVDQANGVDYYYLIDTMTRANLVHTMSSIVDESLAFDTKLDDETWSTKVGVVPTLQVGPNMEQTSQVVTMVLPVPIISATGHSLENLKKVVRYIETRVLGEYENTEVDLMFAVETRDMIDDSGLSEVLNFLRDEEGFTVNVLGDIFEDMSTLMQEELERELSLDEDDIEEFDSEVEDDDYTEDEDEAESEDEDEEDLEDEDETGDLLDDNEEHSIPDYGFDLPSNFNVLIDNLKLAGIGGSATVLASTRLITLGESEDESEDEDA